MDSLTDKAEPDKEIVMSNNKKRRRLKVARRFGLIETAKSCKQLP